ncbi:hypothetical protein Tco_0455404 [Tanacetum coccineum]
MGDGAACGDVIEPTSVLVKWLPFTNRNSDEAQTSEHGVQNLRTFAISAITNSSDVESGAFVQPVTQSKVTTDLEKKKKKILPSSKPKSPYKVRVILLKKQVTETQHAEVIVATADATKSLVAFELAEEQGNQLSAAEVEKVIVF